MIEGSIGKAITVLCILLVSLLRIGCDEKPKLHIVLELDTEEAIDTYLDSQARDVILSSLKRERILCKSVVKALEVRGDNMLILRPYAPEGSEISQAEHIASLRKKLVASGFSEEHIKDTSDEGPELTVRMNTRRDTGSLMASILEGSNSLIVTIVIPKRSQGSDAENYLKAAEETLDGLEIFDRPRRMRAKVDNVAVFSVALSEESVRRLVEDNLDVVIETLKKRVKQFGLSRTSVTRVSDRQRRILVKMPEKQAQKSAAVKNTMILEIKLVKPDPVSGTGKWAGAPGTPEPSPDELPLGVEVRRDRNGVWYVLDPETFMTGADLKPNSARVMRDQLRRPEVIMFLNDAGRHKFSHFTGLHVGESVAILLDEVVYSAPRINERVNTSSARISGDFTKEEADFLAKCLKTDALPAYIEIVEESIVAPE